MNLKTKHIEKDREKSISKDRITNTIDELFVVFFSLNSQMGWLFGLVIFLIPSFAGVKNSLK